MSGIAGVRGFPIVIGRGLSGRLVIVSFMIFSCARRKVGVE